MKEDELESSYAGDGAPVPVRVWWARVDQLQHPRLRERYLHILSDAERQRYQRFRFERDQAAYLAAHALLRLSLASHTGVAPQAWDFGSGLHGKPFVAKPGHHGTLEFNLSHAAQLVACVISEAGSCGIDVEPMREMPELEDIARNILTREEQAAFGLLDPGQRLMRFFDLWSLKEAYLKALGTGLLGDAQSVSFSIDAKQVHAQVGNGPWQFHLHRLEPDHRIAVAVRGCSPWPPVITNVEL
jgi:4'-phosphopantetheinyl transferase